MGLRWGRFCGSLISGEIEGVEGGAFGGGCGAAGVDILVSRVVLWAAGVVLWYEAWWFLSVWLMGGLF